MIIKDSNITKHVYYVDGSSIKHKVCMAQNGTNMFYPATGNASIGSMSWPYESGDTLNFPNTTKGTKLVTNYASYSCIQPKWSDNPGISKIPTGCTGYDIDAQGGLYFNIPASTGTVSWSIGVSAEVYPYNGTIWLGGGQVYIPVDHYVCDVVAETLASNLIQNTWNTIWYEIILTRDVNYDSHPALLYPIMWSASLGNTVSRNIRQIAMSITPI